MGKMKEVGGTPGPAGKSGGKKKNKKNKTEIVFDEAKRVDFLTGFRRRKEERRKKAKDEYEKTAKEEMRLAKEKARKDCGKMPDSASHRVVPEIEHLLEQSFPTDVHDMGSHMVSVTHLELETKVPLTLDTGDDQEAEESEEEEESGGPRSSGIVDKKKLKKAITKSLNEIQSRKPKSLQSTSKSKKAAKYSKKTTKSKRLKHHNGKKIVASKE